ncbi:ATPase [Mariniphaga sp.]|uniref:ATPase n=1 Tax=Mariniphaga sp. TaxID=1954475 RepID=UPI0035637C90
MIIIADSGSTKTSWCFSEKGKEPELFNTGGVNPFFRTTENIVTEWKQTLLANLSGKVDRVFFYGAGVVNEEKAVVIKKALDVFFPEAEKEVHSDLLAAAHATLGNKSGIACILGTGSNSCLYDGKTITAHVPPLGFILGDEGSGAVLGRQLVGDFLKKTMPGELQQLFQQKYPLEYTEFLNRVYRHEKPNQFLAGFVPFLSENIQNEYCQNLVENAFDSFILRNVAQYSGYENQPVCFVGSVAFYFQEQLKNVLLRRQLVPGIIVKEPLLKLMEFHLQNDNHE